ncbi:MAG TPA: serine hydrolase [Bryobacteraceae bacterium]|jgi:N-acyl-D-amino-acid deacylase|nr:serine hydrolase [Bryobacteraceae bacterium]
MFRLSLLTLLLFPQWLSAQVLVSGPAAPGLTAFDTTVLNLMTKWSIPGAALGITRNGRLVFAHGYGYADVEDHQPAQPDSRFRLASISKPFTAAAVLKLIEQGKLQMSTPAFSVLSDLTPPPSANVDQRIYQVTVQELLAHTGGWDRDIAGDPPFIYLDTAAETFMATPPATPDLLIRYMMGQPLQYDPGTTYAYSNFGYIVLGAVIERASGMLYADYVTTYILNPAGIGHMQPGASLLAGRLANEVKYYDYPGAPLVGSAFPPLGALVPEVYGGFSTELMLANGGWIASTMDILRYADNINGQLSPGILQSPPDGFVGYVPPVGLGWGWEFDGSLPGTSTILHLDTGYQINGQVTYAILFNTRQAGSPSPDILADADAQLLTVAQGITNWPSGDLFPTYTGPGSACTFQLSGSGASALPGGGSGTFGATVSNNCSWIVTSDSPWLTINAGGSGTGSSFTSYSVAANPDSPNRTGTLSLGGQPFVVAQTGTGLACDIDHSGSLNVGDAQAIINEALGTATPSNDLNGDGVLNIIDVQSAINAVLGVGCLV